MTNPGESGFTVTRLAPERPEPEAEAATGDDRLVTVVGTLADLTPGEAIVAHDWWRNDANTAGSSRPGTTARLCRPRSSAWTDCYFLPAEALGVSPLDLLREPAD